MDIILSAIAFKKVQRNAAMPGFRPGKVPSSLIKKQYGTSILVEELNKLLNDTLHNYINDNKIEILRMDFFSLKYKFKICD